MASSGEPMASLGVQLPHDGGSELPAVNMAVPALQESSPSPFSNMYSTLKLDMPMRGPAMEASPSTR